MSKSRKTGKVLVRNPTVPIRPGKVVDKSHGLRKVHFVEDIRAEVDPPNLAGPEFCSLLQVADEMKSVRNAKGPFRSLPEVAKYRNLNFLPEEKIYQDLVCLEVPEEQLSEVKTQVSRTSLKKDAELDYSRYLKYSLQSEYFFTPNVSLTVIMKQKPVFDGFLIYNKVKVWKKQIE